MPMVSTIPAMPGRVRVEPISESAARIRECWRRAHVRHDTEGAVEGEHEDDDGDAADDAGGDTGTDGILSEARAHGTFFDHGQCGRQSTRTQQDRQIVCTLNREIAGNLAGAAADDRLSDHRCGDDLLVQHDGKRLADIFLRRLRKALGAAAVEPEADNRFIGALVEGGLRIDEIFTRNQRAPLDQVGHCRIVVRVENFRLCRGRVLIASVTGMVVSTIWKDSLAVWLRSAFRRCGSVRPGTWTMMRSSP